MLDTEIRLIGSFAVCAGDTELEVSPTMRRLIAHLAVCGHPVPRSCLAALIWPDFPDARARANLRAAFWRVDEVRAHVVRCQDDLVGLHPTAAVDLVGMRRRCLAGLRRRRIPDDLGRDPLLLDDLCPSIGGGWIAHDRERWRQLRLHVIVRYLADLRDTGRHDERVDLAERAARHASSLEAIAALRAPNRPDQRAEPAGVAPRDRVRCRPSAATRSTVRTNSRSQPKEASR